MSEAFAAVIIAAVAFGATNLENLVLLVGLMATAHSPRAVAAGYVVSVVIVAAASIALGAALAAVEGLDLSWLGLIPLGLGLYLGFRLIIGGRASADDSPPESQLGFWAALGLSLVNSVDSLAVYGPLFAETQTTDLVVMVLTILGLAFGATWLGRWLVEHPSSGAWLKRVTPYAIPVLLILVGVYIMLDTPTDLVI